MKGGINDQIACAIRVKFFEAGVIKGGGREDKGDLAVDVGKGGLGTGGRGGGRGGCWLLVGRPRVLGWWQGSVQANCRRADAVLTAGTVGDLIRGSHIMFCNLVFQQQLQPLCLLQLFEETPLSLYTLDHPLKPAVYDTWPRLLGYV